MQGDPLHLCSKNHPPLLYVGESCPYCEMRTDLEAAQRKIQVLERKLTAQQPKEE